MASRMALAKVYALYYSCGLKLEDDGVYLDGTDIKADGVYVGYHPKFFMFGKTNIKATEIEVEQGQTVSITSFDKNGNIIRKTDA